MLGLKLRTQDTHNVGTETMAQDTHNVGTETMDSGYSHNVRTETMDSCHSPCRDKNYELWKVTI